VKLHLLSEVLSKGVGKFGSKRQAQCEFELSENDTKVKDGGLRESQKFIQTSAQVHLEGGECMESKQSP